MNLECPYCEEELDDPDDCHKTDTLYQEECRNCGKHFVFTIEYDPYYSSSKADCLNGAPHQYVPKRCIPEFVSVGVYVCKDCDKEVVNKKERKEGLQRIFDDLPANHFDRSIIGKWLSQIKQNPKEWESDAPTIEAKREEGEG